MYPIDIEVLSLSQAEQRYYGQVPLRDALDNLLTETLAVSSYASVTLRHCGDYLLLRETIVVLLHESLLPEVPALARSGFAIFNDHSPDLLDNRTYVQLRGEHVRVRLLQDSLGCYLDPADPDGPVFDVVLACGPLVFVCTHRPSAEQADATLCDLQGCGMSAGMNYQPYRIWSDDELRAASQRTPRPLHGLITVRPFVPNANWRRTAGLPSYL